MKAAKKDSIKPPEIKPNNEAQSKQKEKKQQKKPSFPVPQNNNILPTLNLIQSENKLENTLAQSHSIQAEVNQIGKADLSNQKSEQQKILRTKSEQQNQKAHGLSIDISQFFRQKNIYQPLKHVTNYFTSNIQQGIVKVEAIKRQISPKKQSLLDNHEQQNKLKQIQLKKSQIIQQLKQLYEEQKLARFKRKLIAMNKKTRHNSIQNIKTPDRQQKQKDSSELVEWKNKSIIRLSPTKSTESIEQNQKNILKSPSKEKKSKHYEKSNFTEEEKQKINEIIRRRQQKEKQLMQKERQLEQKIKSEQIEKIKKQEEQFIAQKQKRKQRALQRFMKSRQNKTEMMRKSNYFLTEPSEIKDNEFCLSPDLNLSRASKGPNKTSKSSARKYIYLVNQKSDLEREKQKAKFEEFLLQKRREQTKTDFSDIKVHLKKHNKIKNQFAQIEKQKIQNFRISQKQRLKQIRQKYGFLTKAKQSLLEEEKLSIQKYEQDLNRKMNYQSRMKKYYESIKGHTLVKSRSSIVSNQIKKQSSLEKTSSITQRKNKNFESISPQKEDQVKNNKSRDRTLLIEDKKQNTQSHKSVHEQAEGFRSIEKINELSKEQKRERSLSRKKEEKMMRLLRNERPLITQIKEALQILQIIDNNFWKQPKKQVGTIKSQASLIKSQRNNYLNFRNKIKQ